MVGEHLQARADDDHEEEEGEQVRPADERGHPCRHGLRDEDAGVPCQKPSTSAAGGEEPGDRHQGDGQGGRDPEQPPDREEPAPEPDVHASEAHARMDTLLAEQPLLPKLVLQLGVARGAGVVARVGVVRHGYPREV